METMLWGWQIKQWPGGESQKAARKGASGKPARSPKEPGNEVSEEKRAKKDDGGEGQSLGKENTERRMKTAKKGKTYEGKKKKGKKYASTFGRGKETLEGRARESTRARAYEDNFEGGVRKREPAKTIVKAKKNLSLPRWCTGKERLDQRKRGNPNACQSCLVMTRGEMAKKRQTN